MKPTKSHSIPDSLKGWLPIILSVSALIIFVAVVDYLSQPFSYLEKPEYADTIGASFTPTPGIVCQPNNICIMEKPVNLSYVKSVLYFMDEENQDFLKFSSVILPDGSSSPITIQRQTMEDALARLGDGYTKETMITLTWQYDAQVAKLRSYGFIPHLETIMANSHDHGEVSRAFIIVAIGCIFLLVFIAIVVLKIYSLLRHITKLKKGEENYE